MLAKDAGCSEFEFDDPQGSLKLKFAPTPEVRAVDFVPLAKQGKVENDPSLGSKPSMFERALGRPLPTLVDPK